jgi:hypothetical protein
MLALLSSALNNVYLTCAGLPHAHCLFILMDKILSARHIDAAISAEMPDPVAEPEYHALTVTHMLHPRCDVDTSCGCRRSACGMLQDCCRNYPKPMGRETIIIPDGYPRYRRRGAFSAKLRDGRIVTDNWVVAHNKYLLMKYRCHINVEVRQARS